MVASGDSLSVRPLDLFYIIIVDDQPVNLLVRGTIQDVYDRRS